MIPLTMVEGNFNYLSFLQGSPKSLDRTPSPNPIAKLMLYFPVSKNWLYVPLLSE